jgi:hypothetical protein
VGGGGGWQKKKKSSRQQKCRTSRFAQKGKIEKFVEFDIAIINKPSKSGK